MIVRKNAIATVVITTHNRLDLLVRALESCRVQTIPLEVIVVDDVSTDDTSARISAEWPDVRLIQNVERQGYIYGRNYAASLSSTQYLFSIDDDAEYSDPKTIEKALRYFDHPRVAGVSMPHINVYSGAPSTQPPPNSDHVWVSYAYVGTSHGLRRDLFIEYGAYDESFVHQAEEIDYCERLRAKGYVIRLVDTPPVFHYESPHRDFSRQDLYGARNALLIGWRHAPLAALPGWTMRTVIKSLLVAIQRSGVTSTRPLNVLRGVAESITLLPRQPRQPVSSTQWALSLRLRRSGPLPLSDIEAQLPALCPKREPSGYKMADKSPTRFVS
jgi:GT2 family glycosyltransferase